MKQPFFNKTQQHIFMPLTRYLILMAINLLRVIEFVSKQYLPHPPIKYTKKQKINDDDVKIIFKYTH